MDILERTFAQTPEMLELQVEKISGELRTRNLEGWVFLQNGWFSSHSHRKQVQWVERFLDWHYGTFTSR